MENNDTSLIDLASNPEDSNNSMCDNSVTILEEVKTTSKGKKKKKNKKNKNLDLKTDSLKESDFIILDSTGYSPQKKGEESTAENGESSKEENKINASSTPSSRKNSLFSLFNKPDDIDCDGLFQIDTTPSTKDSVAVPKYRSSFGADEVIGEPEKTDQKTTKPRGGMCWNCGFEGHQIRDCKKKRNPMMINKFRMEAMAKRNFRMMQSRYHEEENVQYKTHLPGVLSSKLRKAMGLEDNQLPEYIYRMRVLGYPPGWLEEAKIQHSGINMFDSNGEAVADPNDEEGEIVALNERDQFDLNKLVEFPGFNVSPPKDTVDQSQYYNVPPMVPEQSLESLIAQLKPKAVQAYRKRKLAMESANDDDDEDVDSDYMETEELFDGNELPEDTCKFVPSLPQDKPPAAPPPPPEREEKEEDESSEKEEREEDECSEKEEGEEESEDEEENKKLKENKNIKDEAASTPRSTSPSLTQLELYKTELLSQLNTTSSSGAHRTPVAVLGKVKSVNSGTPVLKLSPYQNLPSFDKFKENVSDVINFENLPDSTGKYNKLIPLLQKVKKVMTKINE